VIKRRYAQPFRYLLDRFPVVTVLGPRQCGKTTFIRRALPGWKYFDLERPADAAPLASDPEARLRQIGERVIFDEAQQVPEIFPVLRGIIDRSRARRNRYVLLGSASPSIVRGISESLAGRTAFLDLAPFRWDEVTDRKNPRGLSTLWFRGGFPRAYLEPTDRARHQWLESYSRAFIERDLPLLGIDVSPSQMRKLWTMLAHSNGTLWNASQLASSMGVSYHTVNRYVDILEQTFLIRKLPPFFSNVGKRLVKSPKVYFRDSGLLHFFLGIPTASVLDTHPARGLSWEAFIIDQMITAYRRVIPRSQAYFWRTAGGEEVDLLIDTGRKLVPFEIKLHSAPNSADARGLKRCLELLDLRKGYVLYPGTEDFSLRDGVVALSAQKILAHPEDIPRL
jgi:predicted AAA+ superfamily ATPase